MKVLRDIALNYRWDEQTRTYEQEVPLQILTPADFKCETKIFSGLDRVVSLFDVFDPIVDANEKAMRDWLHGKGLIDVAKYRG